ncbi:MAG: sodium/solute symporter [Pseudomonadales bacterium]|nr:sodium/solute symporter [Pseudomonadales bacterium]MCP5184476.1 sodium/solute symporter [Pseudomonadales bacterium]
MVHPLDLTVIVAYLALIVWVGLRVSRRVHDAQDYFLAGRSLTWFVIGLSIIGTNVSAEGYVGASGNAYKVGIAQANFEWIGAIPAMILASLVFIPVYWRAGVYSIPEYMGLRYNAAVRVLLAVIASVFAVFAIAVGLWALALTLETYLGWPTWAGILVTGAIVGAYSVTGGLAAVAYTDAVQVLVMFAGGVAIVALGITETNGFSGFATALSAENPDHLHAFLPADHPEFPWPGVLLGLSIVLSPAYWCAGQTILQRSLGARSQWDASASMMFAAFAKTFVPLLIVFPGLLALVMHADIAYPDMALPWVVKNILPPGLSGIMFVAIIAALQSTVDSALNSTSLLITRDIRGVLLPHTDRTRDLIIGRRVAVVLLVTAMLFAPAIANLGGIYVFIQTLLSLFQGPTLALLVLGAFTRHATPAAGLVTLVTGVAVSGTLTLLDTNMLFVAFWSFAYALVCLLVVSFFTPRLEPALLDRLVYRRVTG